MPLDLPTFGDDFLEREATQFLQTHLGPDLPIPVDMELLIERIEGLDLDYWPALRANYGIEGGVWRDLDTGELFVTIDEHVMADDSPRGGSAATGRRWPRNWPTSTSTAR